MQVTKVGNFTEEEVQALSEAGKILGSLAKALETGDINVLGTESSDLVKALADVLSRIGK